MDVVARVDSLRAAGFAAHRGEAFGLEVAPARVVEAELVEVTVGAASSERNEQFSLVFRAPVDAPVEQRIYTLTHPVLNTLQMFLVPVGRSAEGVFYEAAFNRLSQEGDAS